MLIWMLLFFFGIGVSVLGLVWLVVGVAKKIKKKAILGVLMPVLYLSCFAMLWEADRRFIQEETRKNGGELPDWAW